MSNMDVVKVSSDCGIDLYISIPHGTVRVTLLNKCPEVGWISTLMVDEQWRGKGIGNELLRSAEKVSRENKCSVSSLQVVSDSWMREWYEKKGYFVTADGYEEDMIILTKKLDYIEEYPVGVWIPVDKGLPPKFDSDDCCSKKGCRKDTQRQKVLMHCFDLKTSFRKGKEE